MRSGDVFIHGIMHRSGTNFLSRALLCHPCLAVSPKDIWEFPHLAKSDPVISYAQSMARSPKLPQVKDIDVLQLVGDAWLAYAAEGLPEGCRLVIKEPSVLNLRRFFYFFPRSRLIALIRDGRDVACSALKTRFASPGVFHWRHPRTFSRVLRSPISELARRWSDASRTLREFLEEFGEQGCIKVVRYEDLVRNAEYEMLGILDFLNLPSERYAWDSLATMDVRGSSFVDNRNGELNWEGGSAPESFDPIGRWRQWSPRELRQFHSVAAGELRHWGYLDTPDCG